MVINEHPDLVVDSTSLQYDIIFGADFLDQSRFHLDYDNNLVCWIEYDISICDTDKLFSSSYYSFFMPIDKSSSLQHASLMPNMNRPTSTMLPLINTIIHWISNII